MNNPSLTYQIVPQGRESAVSALVWEVFGEFEAPEYSAAGIRTFQEFIAPEKLAEAVKNEGFIIYGCYEGDILVGVLAFWDISHISLLFVKKSHHRRGIAKELLNMGITDIMKIYPEVQEVTVNSSPYAVSIYQKLGFCATDVMREQNGIKYTPMKKVLL